MEKILIRDENDDLMECYLPMFEKMVMLPEEQVREIKDVMENDIFMFASYCSPENMFVIGTSKLTHSLVEYSFDASTSGLRTQLCGEMALNRSLFDVNGNGKTYVWDYYDIQRGDYVQLNMKLGERSNPAFKKFLDGNGVVCDEYRAESIRLYMNTIINKATNYRPCIDYVGFNESLDGFYLNKLVTKNGCKEIELSQSFKKYVQPSGSKELYDEMLKSYVTTPELHLALALGVAGITTYYLKDTIDTGTILTAMVGKSTTGKTTASQLAISLFASPNFDTAGGFGRTANATNLSVQISMNAIHGLTYLIDDVSASRKKGIERLVYELASGQGKGRCDVDYSQKENAKWGGLVIFNSEKSMFEENPKEGANVRLLSFNDFKWTYSASQSQDIKTIINTNYGFYGQKFVEMLLNQDKKILKHYFNEIYKKFKQRIGKKADQFTDRCVIKLSVIMLSAFLLNNVLQETLELKLDDVFDLLVKEELDSLEFRNRPIFIFEKIKKYLLENHEFFATKQNRVENPIGTYEEKDGVGHYFIKVDEYESMLASFGENESPRGITTELINRNFIIKGTESDRNTTRKTIRGKSFICYHLVIQL